MMFAQKLSSKESNELNMSDFNFFKSLLYELSGIHVSEKKVSLVQTRLKKRLSQLNLQDYTQYKEYLKRLQKKDSEFVIFVNMMTTNKTDWFREPQHFDYLVKKFLPKWLEKNEKELKVWCAASSTGQEAYTLAFILEEYLPSNKEYQIFATDIDTSVLNIGNNGVFPNSQLHQIPDQFRKKHLISGNQELKDWFCIKKSIRDKVHFSQYNLVGPPSKWKNCFDLIFCRNVLIYFEHNSTQKVIDNLFQASANNSALVIGHSETLQKINSPFKASTSSVHTKGKLFEKI